MKTKKYIEELIKKWRVTSRSEIYKRTLTDTLEAHAQTKKMKMAVVQPGIWRIIMRSRKLKYAVAAMVGIAVMVPLVYGASKIIKTYFFKEEIKYTNPDGSTISQVIQTGISGADEKEAKKVYDEINRLREAGKCEKILQEEWVEDGIRIRKYKVHYTLSSGKIITMDEAVAEEAPEDKDN